MCSWPSFFALYIDFLYQLIAVGDICNYNAKGKKTKRYYKKNASLKAFGTKTIKGKKYYILGKGRYICKNAYRYSTQTKKMSRTIKMYTPKGVKKIIQKAYIKRTVKTNKQTATILGALIVGTATLL